MNIILKIENQRIFVDKITLYYQENNELVICLTDFNKIKTKLLTAEDLDIHFIGTGMFYDFDEKKEEE